jgi:YVTN family beta-propeller protein/parallel beta-helix repeat protein
MGVKGIGRALLVAAIVASVAAASAAGTRTEHAAWSLLSTSGTWSTRAAMPTPRAEPSIAVLGGQVHVVGGHLTSQLSTHEAYDPAANTWSSRAARPQVGASRAHGVINGILYEAGGVNCCVEVNNTWAYDPATNSWSAKASMPTTRQAAMGGVVSDKLIVTGGVAGGTFYASTEVYDPASNTWATKAPMPTARDRAAAGVIDGVFYVAGGRNASGALAMLEAYDFATDTWTTKTPMPTARHTSAAAVLGGRLYVFGGHDGSGPLSVVEVYDPATNSWSTESAMPTARAQLVAATAGGTIYAIGGDNGSGRVGTNEAFTPSAASPPLPPGARPPATAVVATITVPSTGIGLAYLDVNPAASRLYATHNGQPGEAAVIDTSTNSVIRRVALGVNTERVAVDELTGRVYVTQWSVGPSGNSAGLAVLNADGDVLQTLTSAGNAAGLGVDPVAQRAFFASGYPARPTNTLTDVDTSTMPHTVVGSTELDSPPVIVWDVTANPVRGDLYAVGIPGNSVAIHDSSTLARTGTIGVGTDPVNLDVHVGGDWLYVANSGSDSVSVVDASTNHVVATIPVGDRPDGIALDSVSNHVYVANFESDTISVIDAATNSVVATVPVGDGPKGVAVDPVTGRVYVANFYDNTISVIDQPAPPPPPNVVVNTNDSGPGSLRAAIEFSNTNPGPETIVFAIPALDPGFNGQWFTIRPLSPLPQLTGGGTTIDGATQTLSSGDTNSFGPEIVLNGGLVPLGSEDGSVFFASSGNRVHSLVINGFATRSGVEVRGSHNVVTGSYIGLDATGTAAVPNAQGIGIPAPWTGNRIGGTTPEERNVISGNTPVNGIQIHGDRNVVEGNFIGTDRTGTQALGNGLEGVGLVLGADENVVGGPSIGQRNIISANGNTGVFIGSSGGANRNVVQGNFIGTDVGGTALLGNAHGGITVAADLASDGNRLVGNLVAGNRGDGIGLFTGTGNVVEENSINRNGGAGVRVGGGPPGTSSTGDRIQANKIHDNGGLGIDLGGDGVTPNDTGDADEGPNHLQNFPVITSAWLNASGSVRIRAIFSGAANTTYRFDWYASSSSDPSGFGEGERVLGSSELTTDGNGDLSIDTGEQLTTPVTESEWFTGTATAPDGSTSEFSRAVQALDPRVVVNASDGGPGSLRAAIEFANGNPGPDTISFAIPPTDPGFNGQWFTIRPTSPLPPLTDGGTSIDGSTQTLSSGDTNPAGPEIELNGSLAGPAIGLLVQSSGNRIHALTVNGFQSSGGGTGLGIQLRAADNVLTGSYLGTDPTGTTAVPNGEAGVSVGHAAHGNRVGGTAPGDRNVISGNVDYGVILLHDAEATLVAGNYIGTNAAGTAAIPNGSNTGADAGMHVQGSNNTIRGNVISGNEGPGIGMFMPAATGNLIRGNFIGTSAAATAAIPNSDGVAGGGTANTIGGPDAADRNVISGNEGNGVTLFSGGSSVVEGNYIGTDVSGAAAVPNLRGGVSVHESAGNRVAGNVISGNVGDGITFSGTGSTGNAATGNYIGTNAAGTAALPNTRFEPGGGGGFGIIFHHASGNTIGGTTPDARNVISGNDQNGIQLGDPIQFGGAADVSDNVVQGNYVGTDATGTTAIANGTGGVFVFGPGNTITANVVSGNRRHGIGIALEQATGNVVEGNKVGTDAAGTAALPNETGVSINGGASNNTVGGSAADARNVISGNTQSGVSIDRGTDNAVLGNYIGTDAVGAAAVPNGGGIRFAAVANSEIRDNLVSGNDGVGIGFFGGPTGTMGNTIAGNLIGADATGMAALPNGGGISFFAGALAGEVRDNVIGGPAAADRNVISGNTGGGISFSGGPKVTGNTISGNYIGVAVDGSTPLGNGADSVGSSGIGFFAPTADGPNNNRVESNRIAYNRTGIDIAAGAGNVIESNRIAHNRAGIHVAAGAGNVVIGNLISANSGDGINVGGGADQTVIQGNRIGTDAAGTAPLGNGGNGILLGGASSTVIGGAAEGARNVISGNGNAGVRLIAGSANRIQGNYVGVDATGAAPLGNRLSGVIISAFGEAASEDNVVMDNVIGANGTPGAEISGVGVVIAGANARENTVRENWIGTNSAGAQLGNDLGGVVFHSGSHDNLLSQNVIAFNGGTGVGVGFIGAAPVRNTISRNAIFSNGGLGIDLAPLGVTPNDAGDADAGPNELMNFPVLVVARLTPLGLRVVGRIDTLNPETVTIELFANRVPSPGGDPSGHGEGAEFLGTATPGPDGGFTVVLPSVPAGTLISATATDAAGNTSEFAENTPARAPGPP